MNYGLRINRSLRRGCDHPNCSLDMGPSIQANNTVDSSERDLKMFPNSTNRIVTRVIHMTDNRYVRFSQLRSLTPRPTSDPFWMLSRPMSVAARHELSGLYQSRLKTAFSGCILHVLFRCAQKEMRRSDTATIVTVVANVQLSVPNVAIRKNPRNSGSCRLLTVDAGTSVASNFIDTAKPIPTSISFAYLIPKPLCNHSEQYTLESEGSC